MRGYQLCCAVDAAVGVEAAAADDHCTAAGHAAPECGAVTVAGASGCVAAAAAGAYLTGALTVLLLAGVQHSAAPAADMCTDSGTCNARVSQGEDIKTLACIVACILLIQGCCEAEWQREVSSSKSKR